jgi:hypothetical protein
MWIRYLLVLAMAAAASRNTERKISVQNESGGKVSVSWINPDNGSHVLMSTPDVMPGADFPLNSFVGHSFGVEELPGADGLCHKAPDAACRSSAFVVSENDQQFVRVTPALETVFVDNKLKARQDASALVSSCQRQAEAAMAAGGAPADQTLQDLVACVEGGVASRLEEVNEEIAFQASVRKDIAEKLENYTCVDAHLESSADVETLPWSHDGVARQVHVKHSRPTSRIHVIENFISPAECKAMEDKAAITLHRATVADGRGGSKLSENRKALQAGIKVPWDKEAEGHPIAKLSRRVYDYTNHVLGLQIDEFGQEDLMSIQYVGRGRTDEEPDRYTPHCDGECTGQPHKLGTRMATVVIYCTVSGHTRLLVGVVVVVGGPTPAVFVFLFCFSRSVLIFCCFLFCYSRSPTTVVRSWLSWPAGIRCCMACPACTLSDNYLHLSFSHVYIFRSHKFPQRRSPRQAGSGKVSPTEPYCRLT